jgi:hypothetical protein
MVDVETGDYVSVQGADREYQKFILHLRDSAGAIGRVFDVQLNHGDSKPRKPFPVVITSMRDPMGWPKADMAEERISIERLAAFLAVWPALNKPTTSDFVVGPGPARMGGR